MLAGMGDVPVEGEEPSQLALVRGGWDIIKIENGIGRLGVAQDPCLVLGITPIVASLLQLMHPLGVFLAAVYLLR